MLSCPRRFGADADSGFNDGAPCGNQSGHTRRRPRHGTPNAEYTEHPFEVSTEAPAAALGATEVHWDKRPADADYMVLADPEGNRFCVVDAN